MCPLGPIERTEERVDANVSNNRHYYYLRDAAGGQVGLIVDDDAATPGHPACQPPAAGRDRGIHPPQPGKKPVPDPPNAGDRCELARRRARAKFFR